MTKHFCTNHLFPLLKYMINIDYCMAFFISYPLSARKMTSYALFITEEITDLYQNV